jgi:hypothetical protein
MPVKVIGYIALLAPQIVGYGSRFRSELNVKTISKAVGSVCT